MAAASSIRHGKSRLDKVTIAFVCFAASMVLGGPLRAQGLAPDDAGDPAKAKPGLLSQVGIDQHLNQQVPLHLAFNDESGREVHLGELFGKRPVILAMVYYECPMLCTQVLNGLVSALGVMNFDVGREFAEWHERSFTALQMLVVLHVAAIVFYAVSKRIDLVRPMVTGQQIFPADPQLRFAPLWRAALVALVAIAVAWFVAKGLRL